MPSPITKDVKEAIQEKTAFGKRLTRDRMNDCSLLIEGAFFFFSSPLEGDEDAGCIFWLFMAESTRRENPCSGLLLVVKEESRKDGSEDGQIYHAR